MNPQEFKKLKNRIIKKLKEKISPEDTIVAGISGGPDSIFLLYFLQEVSKKVVVAHINHSLRKDADKEEVFVKKTAENWGLNFESIKKDIKSIAKNHKKGLEETGRIVRYEFFKKLKNQHNAKFIITAHHANDNLETILFNFARGANLQGLAGMKEIEEENEMSLFRPLLSISKKEILDFLKTAKIKFKTDESNKDTKFKRNFIRHKIIPELEKLNPSLTETVTKNCEEIRIINQYLKTTAQNWIKKNSIDTKKLNAKSFRLQNICIQKIILLEVYKKIIGNTLDISQKNINEVISIIEKNVGNKQKKLGKLMIEIKNNTIRLKKNAKKSNMR
jgi:tRNA(Ile)-lysidine synthase